jgi:hypothetical protein
VRLEVLTAVKMSMLVFWGVTPCGAAYNLDIQGGMFL